MSKEAKDVMGLKELKDRVPDGILGKLHGIAVSYCLTRSCVYAKLIEAVEAISGAHQNARYIGVRLEPLKK